MAIRIFSVFLITVLVSFNQLQAQSQPLAGDLRSLYSDLKALEVGDIVTVLIMENAQARQNAKSNTSSKAEAGADSKVTGTLTKYLPLFGAASSLNSALSGSEGTEQNETLSAKITARVIEKNSQGLLHIKGERTLEVNGRKNLLRLEGWVRPRDILADNTVYSYNLADAKITYRKAGVSGALFKPGTLQRWGNYALLGAIIAAAMLGIGQ